MASQRTVDEGRQLAAVALEAAAADIETHAGRHTVSGTDLGIGLFELAARQPGQRLVVSAAPTAGAPSRPDGCHVAAVEIDPAIGATPAVVNAGVDALTHAGPGRGAERVQMPLTSEVVWRALRRDFGPPVI